MVLTQVLAAGIGAVRSAPPVVALDDPAFDDVQLTSLTQHGWRVSDTRRPSSDPLHVLAFIERRGTVFEVMQLGRGFEWHEFASLDDAIGFVLGTAGRFALERVDDRIRSC